LEEMLNVTIQGTIEVNVGYPQNTNYYNQGGSPKWEGPPIESPKTMLVPYQEPW